MSTPGMQTKFQLMLLGLLQPKWQISQKARSSEQGITLLECIMAIAIMGLTFALIIPPLLIASATRVQNRRAEQALQLAQREVDRIDTLMRRSAHTPANLPGVVDVTGDPVAMEGVAAPAQAFSKLRSPSNCTNGYAGEAVPATNALLVDVDGNCTADFMVQVFRNRGTVSQAERSGQNRPSEFYLGVRVYSILAGRPNATSPLVGLGGNLTGLETKAAQLTLTSGEKNQLRRPLAVVYTRMTWSERDGSACAYLQDTARNQISGCQNTF